MSSIYEWKRLHPATRRQIEYQTLEMGGGYQCGCHRRGGPGRMWLCQYHEGFEDGVTMEMTDE